MDANAEVKIPGWLKGMVAVSLLVAVIALGLYFWSFNDQLADKQETWGQFGDFIGGTLNPLFAVTALFALLYTIRLQSEELRASREEL